MRYSLGVDLGSSFVAAALAVDDRVEMVSLGAGCQATPAAAYHGEDGALVTGEAAAGSAAVTDPLRAARGFKRRIADPTPLVLGGRPFTPGALLGAQLRDVLATVEAARGGPPQHVVLTHPAHWGPFRRALFDEVVRLGGLDAATTITEPEAAATRYAASRGLAEGRAVAVYDLGGGSLDIAVLRKRPEGMEIVGSPGGVDRLGGVDFDEAILRYVDHTGNDVLSELDLRDPPTLAAVDRLRRDCTVAKEVLSADTETVVPVSLPGRRFEVALTRTVFEDLIRAQVESTVGVLASTLDSARVRPRDLDAVLLIGGSARIPLVAELVSGELGRPITVDTQPKHIVALGAAAVAGRGAPATAPAAALPALAGVGVDAADPATPGPEAAYRSLPAYQPPEPPPPYQPPNREPLPPIPLQQERSASDTPLVWPRKHPSSPRPEPRQPQPAPPSEHQPTSPPPDPPVRERGPRRARALVLLAAAPLLVAGVTGWALLASSGEPARPTKAAAPAAAGPPKVVLTTGQVAIGGSYYLTASGFVPGEEVRVSWTGPTTGTMDAVPADAHGVRNHGPVIERDPPGRYMIVATGMRSGRTAECPLEVLPAEPGN